MALQYFTYPGVGESMSATFGHSQAVKIGDIIKCSGQGGWNLTTGEYPPSIEEGIDQAYENVQYALEQAGGTGWDQVYLTRVYMKSLEARIVDRVVANLKDRTADNNPTMTIFAVTRLFEDMTVEVEVEAYTGK